VRPLGLPPPTRALGVNALDEVPDSTWFTNRIGDHDLTPDQIRAGNVTDDPELHKPWTVRGNKTGGMSFGLMIKDTTGTKYVLKFDVPTESPGLQTATHVIVNRLIWAAGYNVAADQIVQLRPSDLVIAPDAVVKDYNGRTLHRLERAELERDLANVQHDADGRIRAMASRWIDGTSLGGHPAEGVRPDDPNDRIPHERRRDLRGASAIYAWVDSADVTEGQYVDSWVTDPVDRARHYVMHYFIDFRDALGVMALNSRDRTRGYAYYVDFPQMLRSLFSLGIAPRPWDGRAAPPLDGVSPMFEAKHFDPGRWRPTSEGYLPFVTADRFDKFWAAAIIARFSRAQIHAAVEAGELSDPRAVEYLTDTLVARQHATVAYWFARVNPLDDFAIDDDQLCFDDLALAAGLASPSATHYALATYDRTGASVAHDKLVAAANHTCTAVPLAPDGYTIVKITTERAAFAGSTYVHLARSPSNRLRVIGVWRT
jgi:hypothetical protein